MSAAYSTSFFLKQESFRNWALGLNKDDAEYWDNRLTTHPDEAPAAYEAAKLLAGINLNQAEITQAEAEALWLQLEGRITSGAVEYESPVRPIGVGRRRFAAAAALALLSGAAACYFFLASPVDTEYTTAYGERNVIELSDGTEVTLNVNSKLRTHQAWRWAKPREVWLEGEAYFNVKSLPESEGNRKFVVHSGAVDVTVLGTKFNVNTRHQQTNVMLDEGKVLLTTPAGAGEKTISMKPGDFVSISRAETQVAKLKPENPGKITSWKQGQLEFDSTSVIEVISLIKDYYGIDVHLDDKRILNETLSGKISSSNVDELFSSMEKMFNLRFTKRGNDVYLTRN